MAWTAPTTRSTGNLITASIWNTDLVDNLAYLKNAPTFDGAVIITGLLTVNGFGTHAFSAGGTGEQILSVRNTSAGTGNAGTLYLGNDSSAFAGRLSTFASNYTTGTYDVQAGVALQASGAGGISIAATHASGSNRFYSGGTNLRWGINAAGDWVFGASSHIADSNGTPTISSGGGTSPSIAGQDYAFKATMGTGTPAAIVVAFGHTWTTAPVCVGNAVVAGSALQIVGIETTTTQATIRMDDYTFAASAVIHVLCRGY